MVKPGGTGTPTRTISGRVEPLPPSGPRLQLHRAHRTSTPISLASRETSVQEGLSTHDSRRDRNLGGHGAVIEEMILHKCRTVRFEEDRPTQWRRMSSPDPCAETAAG